MASGNFTGSGSYVKLKISWSSAKGTGGSTVNATLYAVNTDNAYFYATVNQGYSITINGTSKSGTTAQLSATTNGTATLISNSVWVAYSGNKSITISGAANMTNIYCNNSPLGNRSVSGTAVLDTLGSAPTKPVIAQTSDSVISETVTSIAISWSASTANAGSGTTNYSLQVSVNGGAYAGVTTTTETSYTHTITAGQGNTYIYRVRATNNIGNSDYSYSGTFTSNSVSSPTVGSISTYNPYTGNLTVTVSGGSQTNGNSFNRNCHIYYDWGGTSQTHIGSCGTVGSDTTTLTMTVNSTIQSNVLSALGTKAYSSNNFYAVCWNENSNGSRSPLVTKQFTININTDGGATPVVSASTISGGMFGYGSTCFVAGVSSLVVTIGNVTLRRGGTSYTYKIDVTGYSSGNTSPKTYENLTAGVKTITVTVTDGRGLTGTTTTQVRVQSYTAPTIKSISGARLADPNTSAKVTYTLSYSPIYDYSAGINTQGSQLNGINSQEYSINNGTWSSYTSGTTITDLAVGSTYTINIRVADKVKTTNYVTDNVLIPTIIVPWAFRRTGIGIMCIPQSGYALDVNGAVRVINGDKNIVMHNGVIDAIGTEGTNSRYGNGFIELSYSTPYIDFHYGNSTSDYTSRLIANGENKLTCTSRFDAASFNGVSMAGINFATNTTVSLPLVGSDRGVAIVSIALNGGTLYVHDLVYYNSRSTITKTISLGNASVDGYSIQDSNLVITCNTNWSRGIVVYC